MTIDDALLAGLVRDLADGVVVADPEGTIVFWNAAAERVLGWTAEEAVGRSLDLIIPERHREAHWAGYRRALATGQTRYAERVLEVPALRRDGTRTSIAFTVTFVRDRPGAAPCGIAAVVRDDSERWQERRQLRDELAALKAPR